MMISAKYLFSLMSLLKFVNLSLFLSVKELYSLCQLFHLIYILKKLICKLLFSNKRYLTSSLSSTSGLGLLAHHIHPMEVLLVFAFTGNDSRCADGRLRDHMMEHSPVVFLLLQVGKA